MRLEIKISIAQLQRYEIDETNKKKHLMIMESFAHYIRRLYLRLLRDEMDSNRYKGQWEPIHDLNYIEYLKVIPNRDIYSIIKDALKVEKVGNYFIVRIDGYYKYPGSSRYLEDVLSVIEYGNSKVDARPIMRKSIRFIDMNMDRLYKGYLSMRGVI